MNMPFWLDDKKDKLIIDWLKNKTNRSATIREALYDKINGIGIKVVKEEDSEEIDNDFMDSLNSFKGQE